MKKRSKKAQNISQDEKPWKRVRGEVDEFFYWNKQIPRWTEGTARNLKATILHETNIREFGKVLKDSLRNDQEKLYSQNEFYKKNNIDKKTRLLIKDERNEKKWRYRDKAILYKIRGTNKRALTYKEKNSCFFLGGGNSYNRKLLVSRFAFRELVSFGLVSGLRAI